MSGDRIELKGITWDHTRGYLPAVATAQRFGELHPHVRIRWEKRSLQEFADRPADELAEAFDLLVIDHPWIPFAASGGMFTPLDPCLPEGYLEAQAAGSVGHSFESYSWEGRQWALAVDAAAPVASSRPDLIRKSALGRLPATFGEVLQLAREGLVIIPGIPIDSLMHFYMFCSAFGEDPFQSPEEVIGRETGLTALRAFRELAALVPSHCFDKNPIQVYETMAAEDRFAYCPFAYGYSNYARRGYARRILHFHDLPELDGRPLKSTLGGTGLAVSAACRQMDAALEYITYVASEACQKGLYFDSGGQPGHLSAWKDGEVNRRSAGFFEATLPALERAFLRPRYRNYLYFQDRAGGPLRSYLMNGGSERKLLEELNQLYRESLK